MSFLLTQFNFRDMLLEYVQGIGMGFYEYILAAEIICYIDSHAEPLNISPFYVFETWHNLLNFDH